MNKTLNPTDAAYAVYAAAVAAYAAADVAYDAAREARADAAAALTAARDAAWRVESDTFYARAAYNRDSSWGD